MPQLTAGEECQQAAKALSAFTGTGQSSGIPKTFVTMAMAIAIMKGSEGVAIVRLKTGDWSAPCAVMLENPNGSIQPGQDTVLLFMTEAAVLTLVTRQRLILNVTHRFKPGSLSDSIIDASMDVYAYVRFNNSFTPAELVSQGIAGWGVREDMPRHERWHGKEVTWADVLCNKISVDRSSVGNALYLVCNIAAGGNSQGIIEVKGRKNFADLDKLKTRRGLDGPPPANNSNPSSVNPSPTPAYANIPGSSPIGQTGPTMAQIQQPQMMMNMGGMGGMNMGMQGNMNPAMANMGMYSQQQMQMMGMGGMNNMNGMNMNMAGGYPSLGMGMMGAPQGMGGGMNPGMIGNAGMRSQQQMSGAGVTDLDLELEREKKRLLEAQSNLLKEQQNAMQREQFGWNNNQMYRQ
ncbi:hypothetical protein HDV05_000119 [Chytridiales sp. JEL 0842]|nr:hypothetical protein HDV05_000119 [Chytridiales sp. JEL 0842]